MDKFLIGVVVGFLLSKWLTEQQHTDKQRDGIHFLQRDLFPRHGETEPVLSGLISKNRSL